VDINQTHELTKLLINLPLVLEPEGSITLTETLAIKNNL
jgi:hypothetical protein